MSSSTIPRALTGLTLSILTILTLCSCASYRQAHDLISGQSELHDDHQKLAQDEATRQAIASNNEGFRARLEASEASAKKLSSALTTLTGGLDIFVPGDLGGLIAGRIAADLLPVSAEASAADAKAAAAAEANAKTEAKAEAARQEIERAKAELEKRYEGLAAANKQLLDAQSDLSQRVAALDQGLQDKLRTLREESSQTFTRIAAEAKNPEEARRLIEQELRERGLTETDVQKLKDFPLGELLALLGVGGVAAGTSRLGPSRSSAKVQELEKRIESKAPTLVCPLQATAMTVTCPLGENTKKAASK